MKKNLSRILFVAACWISAAASAQTTTCAAPSSALYGLGLGIAGATTAAIVACSTETFVNAPSFFDGLTTTGLAKLNPVYDGTQPAGLNVYFNSLPISIAYPIAGYTGNGALLTFDIPALGVTQTFNGANRDVTKNELEDYLKHSGIIGDIMHYQAAHSPHSPIAGPGGLIPGAVADDFGESFNTLPSSSSGSPTNSFGIGLQYSSLTVSDLKTHVYTLPVSYTIRNDIDPRRQLALTMPITVSDTGGAKAYHASPGIGYRIPLNDAWTIAPGVRIGVVVSPDIATVAGVLAASVASTYVLRGTGFDVAIGNMVGYYTTTKIQSGDYSFNPNISNTVFRNGVMLNEPIAVWGAPMSVEYSLIDTRYTGTRIFVNNTQELGVTLGTNRSAFSSRSFVRGGLNLIHGPSTRGAAVNIGYWF